MPKLLCTIKQEYRCSLLDNNYYKKSICFDENTDKSYNYYVIDSIGTPSGFLIAAIHNAELVTLTRTSSPMSFLIEV